MGDDGTRWSFRRFDVIRAALFAVAAVVCGAVAIWLPELGTGSARSTTIRFTMGCLAGGAALGVALSLVELRAGLRVETDHRSTTPVGSTRSS